jgi:cobalt-zinc-cadmium efflux system outer membrane protein
VTRRRATMAWPLLALLSACATYRPSPLPDKADLLTDPLHLTVPTAELRLPGVPARHVVDPARGLDIDSVAILAVLNDPELKATRARAGVAQAQLFAAGLLPDPQLSLDFVHPTSGIGTVNGFTIGLTQELNALITRGSEQAAERAALEQTDLEILWAEWQVAQKARELFVQRRTQERLLASLLRYRKPVEQRYERARQALAAGQVALGAAAGNLVTLLDIDEQVRDLERETDTTDHELAALLGLAPAVKLRLTGDANERLPERAEVDAALARLADRRPDLRALRAGYESGDRKLRQAILAQFPTLQVGVTRDRGTDKTRSVGIGITLGLPLLNGNRGNVAIQEATREQLGREYQARLDAAYGEVDQLQQQGVLLVRQLRTLEARLPELETVTGRARAAFDAGNLDAATYVSLAESLRTERDEATKLEQALAMARVGLDTLLGLPPR